MQKWKPLDVISLVIIIGCFVLLAIGRDSTVSWALLAVVAANYGLPHTPLARIPTRRKKE